MLLTLVCRLFAAIKVDLLSICSGTGSLPDDCSGWELLLHMLPLHPDLKRQAMIHNAPCLCKLDITPAIFEEPVADLWSAVFPSLQKLLPSQAEEFALESTAAMSAACTAALASCSLQDRVNSTPALRVTITPSSSSGLGMRAVTADDHDFVAREDDHAAIVGAVTSVLDGTSFESRRVLLLHGVPGLGKSLLATQALRSAQSDLEKNVARAQASQDVRLEIVRGRGAGVVDEDLVALGRNLGSVIDVVSASPPDVVLAALRRFFANSRYVLLIDDADEEGLARALEFLPVSNQRCAVIITSQSLTHDSATQLLVAAGDDTALHFHKQLQPFTPEECMKLMRQVCDKCEALLAKEDDLLTVFGDGLGYLPLAVRLFAEWSRRQYNANMEFYDDEIKNRKKIACQGVPNKEKEQFEAKFRLQYDAQTGRYTEAASSLLRQWRTVKDSVVLHSDSKYSRGLLGTVKLSLLHMELLPTLMKNTSMQLMGLLALCPPVQVPWSLFDGGFNGEAQMFVRGARVEVSGWSLACTTSVPATGVQVVILQPGEYHNEVALIKSHFLSNKFSGRKQPGQGNVRLQLLAGDRKELELDLKSVCFKDTRVKIIDGQLFLPPLTSEPCFFESRKGRVMYYHPEVRRVSVVFGCDIGKCFAGHVTDLKLMTLCRRNECYETRCGSQRISNW